MGRSDEPRIPAGARDAAARPEVNNRGPASWPLSKPRAALRRWDALQQGGRLPQRVPSGRRGPEQRQRAHASRVCGPSAPAGVERASPPRPHRVLWRSRNLAGPRALYAAPDAPAALWSFLFSGHWVTALGRPPPPGPEGVSPHRGSARL